jgi:isopenicillin N synthase-like dioxygenase
VRKALSEEIRDACINVGFFYSKCSVTHVVTVLSSDYQHLLTLINPIVSNHGIPEDTIGRTIEAAKRFFALPNEKKIGLDIHKSSNFKGYTALLAENTDVNNKGDLHEGFDLGPEHVAEQAGADVGAMNDGGNVWPEESLLPGFREEVLDY